MCNLYSNKVAPDAIALALEQLHIPLGFPEGLPNLEPRPEIRITDPAPILRWSGDRAELVQRRWSWPGPGGKPVYNFRSEGREFGETETGGRCLIVADGFYEFTAPADPKAKRKDKWLFTKADEEWFCIAGIWRTHHEVGEAYTMLTCEPGPDVAPYHNRQVVVLDRADWGRWLDPRIAAADLIGPLAAGSLEVERVR